MTDSLGNFTRKDGCFNGTASSTYRTGARTIAGIGLPMTMVAIFGLSLMVRKGQVAPVYLINLITSDFIQFCSLAVIAEVTDKKICKTSAIILLSGLLVSICFTMVIACERYLVIAHPLWYRFRRNIKISLFVCVAVWVSPLLCISIILSVPYASVNIFMACFLLLPFPLLLFFFGGTLKALSAAYSVPHDEKQQILGIQVLVLLSYVLLFLPRIIFSVIHKNPGQSIFGLATTIPLYLSPIVDLVLYVFMKKGISDSLLKCLCCCKINHYDDCMSKERETNMDNNISKQSETEV